MPLRNGLPRKVPSSSDWRNRIIPERRFPSARWRSCSVSAVEASLTPLFGDVALEGLHAGLQLLKLVINGGILALEFSVQAISLFGCGSLLLLIARCPLGRFRPLCMGPRLRFREEKGLALAADSSDWYPGLENRETAIPLSAVGKAEIDPRVGHGCNLQNCSQNPCFARQGQSSCKPK